MYLITERDKLTFCRETYIYTEYIWIRVCVRVCVYVWTNTHTHIYISFGLFVCDLFWENPTGYESYLFPPFSSIFLFLFAIF